MLPKFNKQYSILKLMLGHFNISCLILIKIFILVTHINFAPCSLLRCVKKMVCQHWSAHREKMWHSQRNKKPWSLSSVDFEFVTKVPHNLCGVVAKKPLDNDPSCLVLLRMLDHFSVGGSVLMSHSPFFYQSVKVNTEQNWCERPK